MKVISSKSTLLILDRHTGNGISFLPLSKLESQLHLDGHPLVLERRRPADQRHFRGNVKQLISANDVLLEEGEVVRVQELGQVSGVEGRVGVGGVGVGGLEGLGLC